MKKQKVGSNVRLETEKKTIPVIVIEKARIFYNKDTLNKGGNAMNWTGKAVLGIILLMIGANILLGTLGIHLGPIIGLALAIVLMFYGYRKINKSEKTGGKIFGITVFLFGALLAIGQAHIFVGIFIAALIIYLGYRMVKKENNKEVFAADESIKESFRESHLNIKDSFDEEWDSFLKKNHIH